MVSKWWIGGQARVLVENRHQLKIYTESIRSNFR